MTVHSNDSGVCLVMNAVSSRPSGSPTTQAPHPQQLPTNLSAAAAAAAAAAASGAQPTLTASVATAVAAAAAAAAAAAVAAVPTTVTAHTPIAVPIAAANSHQLARAAHQQAHQVQQLSNPHTSNSGTVMAVTSTIPPGARSTSPCSAAATAYGSSSIPGGASLASSGPSSGGTVTGPPAPSLPSIMGGGGAPPTPTGQPGSGIPTSGAPAGASAVSRCCETGRTIYTDPVSGQTLCSCQYDMLSYQRIAAVGGLVAGPAPIGYPESMSAYLTGMAAEQSPFYPNPAGIELKENLVAGGAPWPYSTVYHPYEAAFAGYPFNSYGMDLNGARRKNATRETTSTLKAWLNEHKKNPYPTKGEKIMLAIITKMTLTQVSTWFANARRRLKKENKMTWEPRNRVDDDDANIDDDDHKSTDGTDILDAKDSGLGSNEDKERSGRLGDMLADRPGESNNSEWSGSRPGSPNGSPDLYDRPGGLTAGGHPLFHPAALHHHFRPPPGSPPDIAAYHHHQQQLLQHHQQAQQSSLHSTGVSTSASLAAKPRIWSLADMASKDGKDTSKDNNSPSNELPPTHPAALYAHHPGQHPSAGKILSPLAARIPNYSPYVRPDLYRGFYGPAAAAHLAGPSQEFLEHQRNINASLAAHNGLSMNPLLWKAAVSSAAGGPHFGPLSLTTGGNHGHPQEQLIAPPSGASPSASSTSSSIGCDVVQPPSSSASGLPTSHHHPHIGPISGNSTSSSTSSNHSGKLSPGINVTSLPGKP